MQEETTLSFIPKKCCFFLKSFKFIPENYHLFLKT